tara:strand:+ start:86 stop:187 length:102 start_codon:yes stop_codon:yes gene_type:complete
MAFEETLTKRSRERTPNAPAPRNGSDDENGDSF